MPASGAGVGGEPRWTLVPLRGVMLPARPCHPAGCRDMLPVASPWRRSGKKVTFPMQGNGTVSPCRQAHGAAQLEGCWAAPAACWAETPLGEGTCMFPLRAFFGQGFLKLKCVNRRRGNPGMKLKRPLAALDVRSRSKDAAVKPGLEQDDTVQ